MPPESDEVKAIRQYLIDSGVPHKVTATIGRYIDANRPCYPHSRRSYHCRGGTNGVGLAVDIAGPTPSWNSPELRAIHSAFGPVGDQLAEILGPGDPDHDDHVHVAVPKGTFIRWPHKKESTTVELYVAAAFPYESGYVIVLSNGQVYAFNCTFRGAVRIEGDRVDAYMPPG